VGITGGTHDLSLFPGSKVAKLKTQAAKILTSDYVKLTTDGFKADLPAANLYGCKVTIKQTNSETHKDKKLLGLAAGFKAVAAYNRAYTEGLPDMTVIFTGGRSVLNCAHHVNQREEQAITLVITDSAILLNENTGVAGILEVGRSGPRGLPDRVADLPAHARDKVVGRIAGIVIHEIGHMLHSILQPAKFWPLVDGTAGYKLSPNRKESISYYCASSPMLTEYVAETFTMLVVGETVGQNELVDYVACGGAP